MKNAGKLYNLVLFQTKTQSNKPAFFQFFSLFGQTGAEKLENPLFMIICFHRR